MRRLQSPRYSPLELAAHGRQGVVKVLTGGGCRRSPPGRSKDLASLAMRPVRLRMSAWLSAASRAPVASSISSAMTATSPTPPALECESDEEAH